MKMIPGEVVGLYLVGIGFIPQALPGWLVVWAVICLLGVIVVKAYGTSDVKQHITPDWIHVLISCVSFVIWVYTMGGPFAAFGLWIPWLGSLMVLVWTFFIPKFYKGPIEAQ
jgi:Flp pilus assembly protein protease CpaA